MLVPCLHGMALNLGYRTALEKAAAPRSAADSLKRSDTTPGKRPPPPDALSSPGELVFSTFTELRKRQSGAVLPLPANAMHHRAEAFHVKGT